MKEELTREQFRAARAYFNTCELPPPYDFELVEFAKMIQFEGHQKIAGLLYRAIRELSYIHNVVPIEAENAGLILTSEGRAIIREGCALLGLTSLENEELECKGGKTNDR